MNAREVIEAALVAELVKILPPRLESVPAVTDYGMGVADIALAESYARRLVPAIVAALDTPAASTEQGNYPCCAQCDAGCSGRHEWPCPRCQVSTTAAILAVADEGAARAKGELS